MYFGVIAEELKYLDPHSNLITLKMLIIAIFVGLSAAVIVSYTDKWYYGNFVRNILSESALSKESAITLKELGYGKSRLIKKGLQKGGYLRRHANIEISNEDEIADTVPYKNRFLSFLKGEKNYTVYDFEKALIYIPENKKYSTEVRYEKKGSNPVFAIIYIIVIAAVSYSLYVYLPKLVKLLDNFIGLLK